MKHLCDFCLEIQNNKDTRFNRIYDRLLSSRIISDSPNFVALPTIGQLFEGSLLIIPKKHLQTFAELSHDLMIEAENFIDYLARKLNSYGFVFLFEHGTHENSGGGCGIYHAHVHLIPIPSRVKYEEFIERTGYEAHCLVSAWQKVGKASEYLLIKDTYGRIKVCQNKELSYSFPSQFLRRKVAERFNLTVPWNWREYENAEPALIRTYLKLCEISNYKTRRKSVFLEQR